MSLWDGVEQRPQDLGLGDEAGEDGRLIPLLDGPTRKSVIRHRGWLVRRMLLAADVAGLLAAFALADLLFGSDAAGWNLSVVELVVALVMLPAWLVAAKLGGLYDHDEERADHSTVDELAGVLRIVTTGVWTILVAALVTGVAHPRLGHLAAFWAFAVPLIVGGRGLARAACRRTRMYTQNTAIVGTGDVGQTFASKIRQHPEYGINLVGFVDRSPRDLRRGLEAIPVLGSPEHLPALVKLYDIERVLIAYCDDSPWDMVSLIRSLNDLDVQVDIVPRLYEIVGPSATMHAVEGLALIGLPSFSLSRSSQLLKRAMDLVLGGLGLIVLLPLFLLIAVLIKLDSRGPVFFRQVRMGAHEQTFRIHKFRTMGCDAEERKREVAHLNMYADTDDPRMFKVPDDPRVTRIGGFLRRFSLDELPQLIDVVRGKMSLVGPRPLILDEDQHVVDWARKRLDLRPGITGLWQVLGRNAIPFEDMTKLDYLYVANWSLWGDLRLILQTIPALVRSRRAY
jgi:exopolysaccharide biosynthesis polyprenyl glycosylphosphotransferase